LALEAVHSAMPSWLDGELVAALAEEGVTPIEDHAKVDGMRHYVATARPTDDDALDEHIAATLRPGYDSRQGLVRPQVVVAWVLGGTP
jgi:molecular chaperone GrpE (heat shock protein)